MIFYESEALTINKIPYQCSVTDPDLDPVYCKLFGVSKSYLFEEKNNITWKLGTGGSL